MRFIKSDLLTLLISLFILASCKNPDSIGLGIDPSKSLEANLVDSTTINTTTATDDTVSTSSITNVPLAFFKDPTLGTTEANIATSLNLPGETSFTAIGDPLVIDSAVLVLNYVKGAYGDLTGNLNATVYQLNTPISTNKSYYSNSTFPHSSTVLGAKTFALRPNDSLYIRQIVVGGPDTLKKVPAHIRIPIDKTFLKNSFFGASASALATNQVFQNELKGLYITVNTTAVTLAHPGAVLFFNMSSSASVNIYYRVLHPTTTPDTLLAALPLGYPHAVEIKHDHSINADIVNQTNPLNPSTASFANVYLQGLAGLRGKLSFPYLSGKGARLLHDIRKKSFADNPAVDTNSIIDYSINQAELRITPVAGSGIPYAPLPRLTMYKYDIAHQRALIPDAYSSDPRFLGLGYFGGFFDKYHQSYSFIVTGYIDDLLRGKLKDYGTFIAAGDTTGVSTGGASISFASSPQIYGRSVIGGGKNTAGYKMKLNILYNKVTK
ncbi:DUF4270 domain-containing protein [Mucilaginibacter sp. HMF5004]|uniref:DUF4270 family protein n=1 Tax=Mucilaginibacter rivuli TaxID=2857527 RepID=UPI001C5DB65B|nr:DUF4270 family protein [Mucilaginibacter rivuli]MBW4888344.1 DUF4270 domain-containing protein [Mucilaginibacter rivuli]